MDEGVQLQQVQARKLGIAKAGGGERRVEQDDGCIRGAGDPLPPAHGSGLATRKGDPVAGMACTERGIRQWSSHKERSEEHTSELQSLMRISYAVLCLKKKQINKTTH